MITPFKQILILALVLACHSLTQAQEARGGRTVSNTTAEKPGKTYAIIMGVSEYQHPQTYPNLSYADDDARAFYHFLKSPEGGGVPDTQIDTLINQNVTIARFNEALANIRTVLKAGDMFYIYFAGHGDALAHDLAFLLPYDAPAGKGKDKEKNHYYNGEHLLINVLTLKSKLRQIAEQEGVRVVFITDACRTDELPGGRAGRQYAYDVIFEKNMGQIQLISCSSNESSLESEDWGNGRGLFSYHLINGLYGMADNQPRDGKVTLSELYDYTKDSVKAYSGYRQNPRYCCGEHDYMVLSRAPSGNFTYRPGNSASPSNNPTLLAGRGIDLGAQMKAHGLSGPWNSYNARIEQRQLVGDSGAEAVFQTILTHTNTSESLNQLLKIHFSARLLESVNEAVNTYLSAGVNNNAYTKDFFLKPLKELRAYRRIADPAYYNDTNLRALSYFFEAHAEWQSKNSQTIRYSLSRIDSAILLQPNAAYVYNIKGLLLNRAYRYNEAAAYLSKGRELAPGWIYPAHNLAISLLGKGLTDSAEKLQRYVISLDTTYQTSYNGMAWIKHAKGRIDSAILYCKQGLRHDPKDPWLWKTLGFMYLIPKNYSQALKALHNAHLNDTNDIETINLLLRAHIGLDQPDSIRYYMRKCLSAAKPDEKAQAFLALGQTLQLYGLDTLALLYFKVACDKDSLLSDAWYERGNTLYKLRSYDNALVCLHNSEFLEPELARSPYLLSKIYSDKKDYYHATQYAMLAVEKDPQNYGLLYHAGITFNAAKNYPMAEEYLKRSVDANPKNAIVAYELSRALAFQNKTDEALVHFRRSVELELLFFADDIRKDKAFRKLRRNREFKILIDKHSAPPLPKN